ncbi:LacI family DNA-binding transcriptional regulator [Amnibacterium sp.]|uniref:LacI family DNA-binding transcriptional regulator n=1 Tax=Amnibacterium sp. TaxID=1872496 RepID=UPI003F7C728D
MSQEQLERRITAADVARLAGVSRATVGFVLNATSGQTISAGTRARVIAAADRLGYRPHRAARALASGQSNIVLLVLPDWPIEHSLGSNLDEASLALDEAGYSLVTWTPHADGRARPLWETLQPDVVLGLVPLTEEQEMAIRASGARIAANPPAPEDTSDALQVGSGPVLQVRHLLELGHERLVYADTADPRLRSLSDERYELARATALECGVELERRPVEADPTGLVTAWVRDGTTAVVAYNDDIAARIIGAATRAGIAVPEKLAVVGHDDAPIAALMLPSISTVHVDTAGLGRYLAALALHTVEGTPLPPLDVVGRIALVRRESS